MFWKHRLVVGRHQNPIRKEVSTYLTIPFQQIPFELWKPIHVRKGIHNTFKPVFTRYIGVEKQDRYDDILATISDAIKNDPEHNLLFDNQIPMTADFSFINAIKYELSQMDMTKLASQDITLFQNPTLNQIFLSACETIVNLAFQQEAFPNDSIKAKAGYMNILFSDKTGTITEGKLSVVDFFLADGTLYSATGESNAPDFATMSDSLKTEMINGIGLNNDAMIADGTAVGSNATDRALLDFLITRDSLDFDTTTITEKEQFNSATKFASVTVDSGKTYIKGAPEFILGDCHDYLDKDGNKQAFTDDVKARFQDLSLEQASRSMRLLAILETDGDDKVLIGIVCIRDNVRSSIKETVATMNRAGVQVVMVTGDRKETAVAIAKEADIIKSDDDIALTHDELDTMSDEELKEALPKLRVVSRALPLDKKRLVNLAQNLDMIAGMTGRHHCPAL